MFSFTQIKETCIYVADLARSLEFYHEKLGLPLIDYQPGRHVFFRAGSSVLLCFNAEDSRKKTIPPSHYGTGKLHFAFEVTPENYDATRTQILALEIEIEADLTWKNDLRSFYFRDPDGHCLEIIEAGAWD